MSQYTSSKGILFSLVASFLTCSFGGVRNWGKTCLLMFYLKLPVDSLQLLELKHSAGLSHYLTHRATYSLPAQSDRPLGVNSCYLLTLGEVENIISLYKYVQVTAVFMPFEMVLFYCNNILNRELWQFGLSALSTLLTEKSTSVSVTPGYTWNEMKWQPDPRWYTRYVCVWHFDSNSVCDLCVREHTLKPHATINLFLNQYLQSFRFQAAASEIAFHLNVFFFISLFFCNLEKWRGFFSC